MDVRLRTGHSSLNGYLARFNIIDDTTCPRCEDTKETVHHFLMVGPKYERLRDDMRRKVVMKVFDKDRID